MWRNEKIVSLLQTHNRITFEMYLGLIFNLIGKAISQGRRYIKVLKRRIFNHIQQTDRPDTTPAKDQGTPLVDRYDGDDELRLEFVHFRPIMYYTQSNLDSNKIFKPSPVYKSTNKIESRKRKRPPVIESVEPPPKKMRLG